MASNLVEQLTGLFQEKKLSDGLKLIADRHPADLADILEQLPEEIRTGYYKALRPDLAAEVFGELAESQRAAILDQLTNTELARLLLNLDSDDAADLVAELPEDQASVVLNQIDIEDQQEVRKLLTYPEDTAGGLMQMEVVTVPDRVTIGQAVGMIREQASEVEEFNNVFVVSGDRQVIGVMSLRELILASPEARVTEVMKPVPVIIRPDDDQEDVARSFQKYDLLSAPVVDNRGQLLGRVTVDDVVDVIQEEASEDLYRMVGTDDEELTYGEHPFKISRLRLPWLLTNLVGGMVTGYLLWLFKVTLSEVMILVTFVPVITAMGGNVGIQTATIFVRGLALGHYSTSHLGRVLFREFRVALIMGVTCGAVAGGIAALWHGRPILGLVVAAAMLSAITLASLVGILAPAFFRRINVDPAIASGPLVTTANDILGILVYLGIATASVKYLMV